jgi:hypothetical protein
MKVGDKEKVGRGVLYPTIIGRVQHTSSSTLSPETLASDVDALAQCTQIA